MASPLFINDKMVFRNGEPLFGPPFDCCCGGSCDCCLRTIRGVYITLGGIINGEIPDRTIPPEFGGGLDLAYRCRGCEGLNGVWYALSDGPGTCTGFVFDWDEDQNGGCCGGGFDVDCVDDDFPSIDPIDDWGDCIFTVSYQILCDLFPAPTVTLLVTVTFDCTGNGPTPTIFRKEIAAANLPIDCSLLNGGVPRIQTQPDDIPCVFSGMTCSVVLDLV